MRETRAQDAVLTRYARSLIQFKARQLAKQSSFTRTDAQDLEQELWLALLSQASHFDPTRASLDTFINCVVNTSVRMILRDRRRQKRAGDQCVESLDRLRMAFCGKALVSTISEADGCRRSGSMPACEQCRHEDQESFENALDAMPAELQDVCRRVMGGSISSAARELGTSRYQIRCALAKARSFFERAGFGNS